MTIRPILIVDDEPTNLAILQNILESEYRLVFARSGSQALTAVEKHNPVLILLDIQMPDIDGYEVCKALKANPATENIPVIFVSNLSDFGHEKLGFSAGCVDYLAKPVVPDIVLARVRTHLSLVKTSELQKSHRDGIFMLGEAGHYNDNDTGIHIWRMAAYSKALAKKTGWTMADVELLELAAAMHDTGKIGISDLILRKTGQLNEDEWKCIKSHCQIGFDIMSKSKAPIFVMAAEIALSHHEKWDGSGYPHGLAGTAIPESARIVAIADVFDALTMPRPYKEPWAIEDAFAYVDDNAGRHFDPDLVKHFQEIKSEIIDIRNQWDAEDINMFNFKKKH